MNRFINALLIFILFPTMLLAIIVGFDLPVSIFKATGSEFPYREFIFLGLGVLIFVVNIKRSIRRWMGMRIVSNTEKFKWNKPVSKDRKRRVNTYLILEMMAMSFVGVGLYVLTPEAWLPASGFVFVAIDNFIFMLLGTSKNLYRIGLSSKALIVADRDVIVLYFTGLRKVSIHQQSIYFDYIKDLQLSFPSECIDEDSRQEFFDMLEAQLDKDRVFFSKTMA